MFAVRMILESIDWLNQKVNGILHFDKTPLIHFKLIWSFTSHNKVWDSLGKISARLYPDLSSLFLMILISDEIKFWTQKEGRKYESNKFIMY